MIVGNYGNRLVFGTGFAGAGFDLSAATNLILTFTLPDLTTLVVQGSDVVLGSTTYTLPSGQTFTAGQWCHYTFTADQVTVAGTWKVRLTYEVSPSVSFTSNIGSFVVGS